MITKSAAKTEPRRFISALRLVFKDGSAHCMASSGSSVAPIKISNIQLQVLEAFALKGKTPNEAWVGLKKPESVLEIALVKMFISRKSEDINGRWRDYSFVFESDSVKLVTDKADSELFDISPIFSLGTQKVFSILIGQGARTSACSKAKFDATFDGLRERGWVVPAVDDIDWGQLRRLTPICGRYGASRGTPIDRYYLGRFVDTIRPLVSGNVLDIGGDTVYRKAFGFHAVKAHDILQLPPFPGAKYLGDAHDPSLVQANRYDAVLAFNVLEHCARPWQIAGNIYRWLKPGGRAFCVVPNAQRLHHVPKDYWRILPQGLESIFSEFSTRKIVVYGNPCTVVGAYLGIASGELTRQELDHAHPDYPVITCIIAQK
jgi:SAM-dependent methyltransferase